MADPLTRGGAAFFSNLVEGEEHRMGGMEGEGGVMEVQEAGGTAVVLACYTSWAARACLDPVLSVSPPQVVEGIQMIGATETVTLLCAVRKPLRSLRRDGNRHTALRRLDAAVLSPPGQSLRFSAA